jgi:hypothetical protein
MGYLPCHELFNGNAAFLAALHHQTQSVILATNLLASILVTNIFIGVVATLLQNSGITNRGPLLSLWFRHRYRLR